MKIEANNQANAYIQPQQASQEMKASQAAGTGIVDTGGVSFQKNPDDCFLAELEQAQGGQNDILGEHTQARSRTEILESLVTEKDLAAFKEHSDDWEDEELEVIVTVVEKIKTQLATYCDDYDSGMVEELSPEQLEKLSGMTGNVMHVAQKLAENNLPVTEKNLSDTLSALELAQNTGILTEDAVKACLSGEMELTIENLYLAQHSGTYGARAGYYAEGNGYYVKAATAGMTQNLQSQIENLLTRAGMPADDITMEQAQWLVDNQIPLTKENLLKYQQLQQYIQDSSDPAADVEEMALDRIMEALSEGKRPFDALMAGEMDIRERSTHAVEVLQAATDEQVYQLTENGQEVTIGALERLQQDDASKTAYTGVSIELDITYVTARRRLEEVRLQMTVQSCAVMMRNGIDVETAGMQQLIDELKTIEDQYDKDLLAGSGVEANAANISLYREITSVTQGIAEAPAELIGAVTFSRASLSIAQVHEQGVVLEEKYRQANEAYEQVMTRPRADMGDSIQKAFQNVDEILESMGIDVTRSNERAVRILGYNSMEITMENITLVKQADMEVNTMLEGMKPSVVLDMIREGYNPLDKTIEEVNAKISRLKDDSLAGQETYSEFLWNLEHSDGISQEEREVYVGLYRLMHQIEKTDGAVVGAMVEQGASMTMRNLLTGIRSKKHSSMDYKIGEIDGVEGTKSGSITEQIEKGFSYLGQLAGHTLGRLAEVDVQSLSDVEAMLDMPFESFAEALQEGQNASGGMESYESRQLAAMQQACESEEEVLAHLTSMDQSLTIGSLLAAGQLFGNRGGLFRELRDYASGWGEETEQELLRAMTHAEEAFTDEAAAKEAYGELLETATELVEQGTESETITYEQMRNWKLLSQQIRLCGSLSEQQEYHIPLQIGEELTSMHVQFVQESGSRSSVSLVWETGVNGKVAARFTAKEESLEGYVVAQHSETRALFAGNDAMLREMIEEAAGLAVSKVDYVQHEQVDLLKFTEEVSKETSEVSVSSSGLYRVAKAVMAFVSGSVS